MVPAHGVTTIFYLLEKARDAAFAREGIERLISVFAVAQVDDNVVRRALALAWPHFEDAVCAAAAEASGCDALVTRDPEGLPECTDSRDKIRRRRSVGSRTGRNRSAHALSRARRASRSLSLTVQSCNNRRGIDRLDGCVLKHRVSRTSPEHRRFRSPLPFEVGEVTGFVIQRIHQPR